MNEQNSLARWFRQLLYMPCIQSRWLTKTVKRQWSEAIAQAELGHNGEICVIVENHLPLATAYHQGCYERGVDLFAYHRVWDTEHNTGVLIYVNLCEHELHIIADRGICQQVTAQTWQALCDEAIAQLKNQQMTQAISTLITKVGQLLIQHQPNMDTMGNELPNHVTFIR